MRPVIIRLKERYFFEVFFVHVRAYTYTILEPQQWFSLCEIADATPLLACTASWWYFFNSSPRARAPEVEAWGESRATSSGKWLETTQQHRGLKCNRRIIKTVGVRIDLAWSSPPSQNSHSFFFLFTQDYFSCLYSCSGGSSWNFRFEHEPLSTWTFLCHCRKKLSLKPRIRWKKKIIFTINCLKCTTDEITRRKRWRNYEIKRRRSNKLSDVSLESWFLSPEIHTQPIFSSYFLSALYFTDRPRENDKRRQSGALICSRHLSLTFYHPTASDKNRMKRENGKRRRGSGCGNHKIACLILPLTMEI